MWMQMVYIVAKLF